jgi:lysosomal acid lipase/cholesteryl ester hydrolase
MNSADEIGFYDMPAMINYVLKTTNREKLLYIGHSLGGGAFFMSMIDHPELNDKIEMMIALAPAVSVVHLRSPLILASTPFIRQFAVIIRKI